MSSRREFNTEEIRSLLVELGRRLAAEGEHASIYIAGGAAMAMTIDTRRVTDDVDGIFDRTNALETAADEVASAHQLDGRWLSDAMRPYAASASDVEATLVELDGLSVSIASPRHLLAMKMAAFRPEDMGDLARLFTHLAIATPEAAVATVWEVYGDYAETAGGGSRQDFLLRARGVLDYLASHPRESGSSP